MRFPLPWSIYPTTSLFVVVAFYLSGCMSPSYSGGAYYDPGGSPPVADAGAIDGGSPKPDTFISPDVPPVPVDAQSGVLSKTNIQIVSLKAASVEPGAYFPTWLAHLYGSKLGALGEMHFLTLTLHNSGAVLANVEVRGELAGFSSSVVKLVKVPPKSSLTVYLDPAWDPKLYQLSSAVPGKAVVQVRVSGELIDTAEVAMKILPVDTVVWSGTKWGDEIFNSVDSVVTLITPNDNWLQMVLTAAAKKSAFGAMIGYEYEYGTRIYGGNLPALTTKLKPGYYASWLSWYKAGQKVHLKVKVTCSLCYAYNAKYALIADSEAGAYVAGKGGNPLLERTSLGSFSETVTIPKDGYYFHIAWNPAVNSSSRSYTIQREMSVYEGAADQLSAIYAALVDEDLVYVSVSGSYFSGAQNIKTVKETLLSGSANCIDGSIVFASALEAMGMSAALLFPKGHAFVGVLCWPKSSCVVPIETTMMGSKAPARKAIDKGFEEIPNVQFVLDVDAQRKKGWLPAPLL